MTVYVPEQFADDEADVLRRYFTNLDGPVFALVNLPEVVKGALFARYSRSPKSLRRLFLDEFVGELDISGDHTVDATIGLERAEQLYERVFFEYGDDSVAQLGGVHLACEQASNLLTKILEWGRLMSYLEQSTRYIAYDARLGGRYRYHRDGALVSSRLGARYVGDMDRIFDAYSSTIDAVTEHVRATVPRDPSDSEFVYRQATRAKALDAARGILPAASLSNVGIYGSGQGFEALLLRMRSHPLPEAREYAELMLFELRKVIPSFLRRVDLPERGGAWSDYFADTRTRTELAVQSLFAGSEAEPVDEVRLLDWDPDAEDKILAAACYVHTSLPEAQVLARVR
ncbi:MAG: FAD-dependent thymidylate synthase, partial [Actinomycetota bacterium]|nr:FAD-dependent thymidylate synthase [Actinomycetota bacterium]